MTANHIEPDMAVEVVVLDQPVSVASEPQGSPD